MIKAPTHSATITYYESLPRKKKTQQVYIRETTTMFIFDNLDYRWKKQHVKPGALLELHNWTYIHTPRPLLHCDTIVPLTKQDLLGWYKDEHANLHSVAENAKGRIARATERMQRDIEQAQKEIAHIEDYYEKTCRESAAMQRKIDKLEKTTDDSK